MAKARRKFQIGDLCTTDYPRWMNKRHWETSCYIYEVVDYDPETKNYAITRTPISLERFNNVVWKKEQEGVIHFRNGITIHHVPDYILAEHKQSQLMSVENLEEYEGLFV